MNQPSRETIEARITALLLGELPAAEAELLRYTISQDAALRQLHDELASTIALVREAAKTPASVPAETAEALRLSQERREKLLAHFKTPRPHDPLFWLKRIEVRRVLTALACVALVALLAALFLPALASAKKKSQRLTALSGARLADKMEMAEAGIDHGMAGPTADRAAGAPPPSPPVVPTVSPAPLLAPPPVAIVLPPAEVAEPVQPATGLPSEERKPGVYSQSVVGYVNQPLAPADQGSAARQELRLPGISSATASDVATKTRLIQIESGQVASHVDGWQEALAQAIKQRDESNRSLVSKPENKALGFDWYQGSLADQKREVQGHAADTQDRLAQVERRRGLRNQGDPNSTTADTVKTLDGFAVGGVGGSAGELPQPGFAASPSPAETAPAGAVNGTFALQTGAAASVENSASIVANGGSHPDFIAQNNEDGVQLPTGGLKKSPVLASQNQLAANEFNYQTSAAAERDGKFYRRSIRETDANKVPTLGADKSVNGDFSLGVAKDSLNAGVSKDGVAGLRYKTSAVPSDLATKGGSVPEKSSEVVGTVNLFSGAAEAGGAGGAGGLSGARTSGGLNYMTQIALDPKITNAARSYFSSLGIDIQNPPGKAMLFNKRSNKLLVRATEQDLDIIARDMAANLVAAPDFERSTNVGENGQQFFTREFSLKPGVNFEAIVAGDMVDQPVALVRKPASIPQPEILTRDNNFSTFSLNVSDVSFQLAAASLERGQMPDATSIRSEEFINAFDYRDPEAAAGQPLAFASERARYPFAQNRDLLRFSIKTAVAGRAGGRALNLVLLLDTSGSMERADRVAIIREALRVLATQLRPADTVSIVTFARTARLWADGVGGDSAGAIFDRVGGITPEGGTNLEEAMRLAYATARRHYLANGMNRVVLLTDGAANLGNVSAAALKEKVEAQRRQGIALDCFGIGFEDYNDDLLEQLSSHGDGRYAFLNAPADAAQEFAAKLAGALQVAAQDVKVQVEFNPQRVISYRQIGYAKHQLTKEQFRDNTVDAAEIAAQEAGNALYTVETKADGVGPIATVRVRYKVPGTSDYRERSWNVEYTGNAPALERSSAAMRLAATVSAFSEWLAASPFAQEVAPDELLKTLSGVPEIYGADARPKKLEWMIRQAKSVTGK